MGRQSVRPNRAFHTSSLPPSRGSFRKRRTGGRLAFPKRSAPSPPRQRCRQINHPTLPLREGRRRIRVHAKTTSGRGIVLASPSPNDFASLNRSTLPQGEGGVKS